MSAESDLPTIPDDLFPHERIKWLDQLRTESDRGAAIVGVALLEDLMGQLLHRVCAADQAIARELLDGPLSSFAARSKMACGLGIISVRLLSNCNLMRKIRNHFAHDLEHTSFSIPPIPDLCDQIDFGFEIGEDVFREGVRGRERFQFAVSTTATYLEVLTRKIQPLQWIPLLAQDFGELDPKQRATWMTRAAKSQKGESCPPRSWYSGGVIYDD